MTATQATHLPQLAAELAECLSAAAFSAKALGHSQLELGKQYQAAAMLLQALAAGIETPASPAPSAGAAVVKAAKQAPEQVIARHATLASLVERVNGQPVPLDEIDVELVKDIALAAGRARRAVNGMFEGKHAGLLMWVQKGKTVRITELGLDTLVDIEEHHAELLASV